MRSRSKLLLFVSRLFALKKIEMETEPNKNKPLTKEETKGLLSLIEGSNIINNKKTNATNNKMKVEEWQRIADAFNATMGTCRRTPQQLRLKWENLKKNSRKRSTLIRMERIKTGGGPPGYFLPDEILDRVAALLGSTGEGLLVMFGGDAEPQFGDGASGGGSVIEIAHVEPPKSSPLLLIDSPLSVAIENQVANGIGEGLVQGGDLNLGTYTPVSNQRRILKSRGVKRKLLDNGCLARNTAITEYFNVKRKVLEIKLENVLLENEKLKLEIRKLKGED